MDRGPGHDTPSRCSLSSAALLDDGAGLRACVTIVAAIPVAIIPVAVITAVVVVSVTGLLLAANPQNALAAPTAVEDCSPDQLPRDYESVPRSDIERRCTRVIAHGSLGPFQIGEDKRQVLDELPADGVQRIALVASYRGAVAVEDPDAVDVIRSSAGVLVHAGDLGDPLRVEFAGAAVSRVMGGASELASVRSALTPGQSRTDVLAVLRAHTHRFGLRVEAFVPDGDAIALPPAPDVRTHVLSENRWRFDASPSLCGFEAFYSQVELIFESDRLVRLEHFCFPYELP